MDFDLEIISEEGDNPDSLFQSIMNAMNSMKEATADKIYQKIQREGETNYSKPQVDRALANALKYGIFEVRNNRYRVREDLLDDEDTVYWKFQKYREETPFQIQDDINEGHFGPKLDPERDNLRFRKLSNLDSPECRQCGRTKRPSSNQSYQNKRSKIMKKQKNTKHPIKKKKSSKRRKMKSEFEQSVENISSKKIQSKRKTCTDLNNQERHMKIRRLNRERKTMEHNGLNKKYLRKASTGKRGFSKNALKNSGKYDSTDESELYSLSSQSEDEQSFGSSSERDIKKPQNHNTFLLINPEKECADHLIDNINKTNRSSISIKSESECQHSSGSDYSKETREEFYENLSCTSRIMGNKEISNKKQYLNSNKLSYKNYEKIQIGNCDRKSSWMEYLDEQKGTIIQSNNVLTIEPMDTLAFKASEQASYIS